jgi:dihydrofolate reductase
MNNIIVAYDKNRAIGNNGGLLWEKSEMSTDMKRFREITKRNIVVMGRKTLESIGIALPNRRNIVMTSADELPYNNIDIAHSLDDVHALTKESDDVFYIGGGKIYEQALQEVEKIYATEIDAEIEPADTYFPEINDKEWSVEEAEYYQADEKNKYPFSFKTYKRNK